MRLTRYLLEHDRTSDGEEFGTGAWCDVDDAPDADGGAVLVQNPLSVVRYAVSRGINLPSDEQSVSVPSDSFQHDQSRRCKGAG